MSPWVYILAGIAIGGCLTIATLFLIDAFVRNREAQQIEKAARKRETGG